MTHPDPELEPLVEAARRRDADRSAWEADPNADPQLKAPLTRAERQQMLDAVLPAPQRRSFAWPSLAMGGGLVAAAAAIFLLVSSGPSLPRFELEVRSQGHQVVRGHEGVGDALALRDGMRVEVILRPATRPEGPVAVQVFLRNPDGDLPVDWAPQASAEGSYRFVGVVGSQLELTERTQALVFVVGPPEALDRGERGAPVQVRLQPVAWAPGS